jgi:hypothetical protein
MAAKRTVSRQAVFCGICVTVSTYDETDLFEGELFCPVCCGRTNPECRGQLEDLKRQHPDANTYGDIEFSRFRAAGASA